MGKIGGNRMQPSGNNPVETEYNPIKPSGNGIQPSNTQQNLVKPSGN